MDDTRYIKRAHFAVENISSEEMLRPCEAKLNKTGWIDADGRCKFIIIFSLKITE
jgi:hypothetical protein